MSRTTPVAGSVTLTFDASGCDLLHGCYWYADWFTYAEEELSQAEGELVSSLYLGGDPSTYFDTSHL